MVDVFKNGENMLNVIAVIWDFDKTLMPGYMQDPIFNHFNVNPTDFWKEVNELPQKYGKDIRVNKDTIYLNQFIADAQPGKRFDGLNNEMLKAFGKQLHFYEGIPEIFQKTKQIADLKPEYAEYGIKVEHYVVSTGMAEMIRGSIIAKDVSGIWGCELAEHEINGKNVIGETIYTIDNTSKTRALFEINKGIPQNPDIDVNAKMEDSVRRVPFGNMIYIADGPSDVPAFSLINRYGGSTFAIYPKGDDKAFKQVEKLREDGRINMYAEANYKEGTTAYMWITNKIEKYANRICESERRKIQNSISDVPKHLV